MMKRFALFALAAATPTPTKTDAKETAAEVAAKKEFAKWMTAMKANPKTLERYTTPTDPVMKAVMKSPANIVKECEDQKVKGEDCRKAGYEAAFQKFEFAEKIEDLKTKGDAKAKANPNAHAEKMNLILTKVNKWENLRAFRNYWGRENPVLDKGALSTLGFPFLLAMEKLNAGTEENKHLKNLASDLAHFLMLPGKIERADEETPTPTTGETPDAKLEKMKLTYDELKARVDFVINFVALEAEDKEVLLKELDKRWAEFAKDAYYQGFWKNAENNKTKKEEIVSLLDSSPVVTAWKKAGSPAGTGSSAAEKTPTPGNAEKTPTPENQPESKNKEEGCSALCIGLLAGGGALLLVALVAACICCQKSDVDEL